MASNISEELQILITEITGYIDKTEGKATDGSRKHAKNERIEAQKVYMFYQSQSLYTAASTLVLAAYCRQERLYETVLNKPFSQGYSGIVFSNFILSVK
jgi:hypothetical protein